MDSVDLYQAVGGQSVCRQLSEAFYTRVERDPVLRPFFPGKSMRCAIEAFTAFLAQFLGGPTEDAEARWWLSLRESHLRFKIGPRERQAWMSNMIEALEDVPIDEPIRLALRDLFERSSAYIVNTGQALREPAAPDDPSDDRIHREIAQRWREQRALDDLVAVIRDGDAGRALKLTQSPALQHRFSRDAAVFAHVLGLMMGCRGDVLMDYAERELLANPALANIRNRYGRTLLHDASAQGNLRMVELLLRLGADPNVGTPGGHTPLYCVANECHMTGGGHIVRALVRAGAQLNAASGAKRCTALHMAARRGNTEIAEALVDCGADINARDTAGDTPLRRAKNCRKLGVALLLSSRGADARLSPPHVATRRSVLRTVGATLALSSGVPASRASSNVRFGLDMFSLRSQGWTPIASLDWCSKRHIKVVHFSEIRFLGGLDPENLRRVRAHANDLGIELEIGMRSICPTSTLFDRTQGTAEEQLAKMVDAARLVGSPIVRCVLGSSADRSGPGGIEAHIEETVKVLHNSRTRIVDAGVKIAIENHAGDMQARELKILIEGAGPDFVGVCLDSGNPAWTIESPHLTLETLSPYVLTSHMRDSAVWRREQGAAVSWTRMGEGNIGIQNYLRKYIEKCPGRAVSLEVIVTRPRMFNYFDPAFWTAYRRTPAWEFAQFVSLVDKGVARPIPPPLPKEEATARELEDVEASIHWTQAFLAAL